MLCHACHKPLSFDGKPGFRAECSFCSADVHVCKNCKFYDTRVYNECSETSAERVTDKEKSNFCEYFVSSSATSSASTPSPADDAKKKLAELFGKTRS